ncbi:MAG: hypothetical protein ABIR26_16495 [Ramlibacter sp.]
MKSNIGRDDKVVLIRIAGAQAVELEDKQARADIQTSLSRLAMTTEDPVLGRAAALMYSRMGFYPDTLALLASARARKHIGDDEYFGDLGYLLPIASGADQVKIAKLLIEGKNGFSRVVLASLFTNRDLVGTLTPSALSDVTAFLTQNEPTFSSSPSIGGTDVFRYADWLNAVVGLTAKATGEPERVVMARQLRIDGADPKTLIAALHNEQNAALIRAAFDRRSLEKIDTAIASFAQQSKTSWVQELAATGRANLAGPKK